jgi:DNA-binding IclR family transcriptional regulator
VKASHFEAFWINLLAEHPEGVTAFEVAAAFHQRLNSISPRSASLKRKGLIRDSGERRLDPHTNRRSIVWVKAS